MAVYVLKDVRYKDILYVEDLKIEEGKISSIVGESGSGKTTLLRLLNKLISCDSGEITFRGKALAELDAVELRRSVVMLPQTTPIFPGTIEDNLQIGLRFAEKEPAGKERLKEVLELAHLSKALDEAADRLSGGEKQRLGLARVFLLEPEVYLLDEPSSALDEETARLIMEGMVQQVKAQHKTLVMVTHARELARLYSDCQICLGKGRIVSVEG